MTKLRSAQALQKLIALVARWSWFLGACAILAAVGALIASELQSPVYRATTVVLVDSHPTGQDTYTNLMASNQLVTTYASLVTQPIVLQQAASQVGGSSAGELSKETHVSTQTGTQILQIQVDNANPQRAAALANAVANALAAQIAVATVANSDSIRVFQPATPPSTPYQPRPLLYGLGGGALGLVLAAVIVAVVELVDGRVRTSQDVEDLIGQPPLALIETAERHSQKSQAATGTARDALSAAPVALGTGPGTERADGYRRLRANLDLTGADRPSRTILVTSAGPCGEKSLTATNLALAIARTNIHVLLVDADVEHPAIHALLGVDNERGLSTYLGNPAANGDNALAMVTVPGVANLSVLTAGPHRPGDEDLLSRRPHWLRDLIPQWGLEHSHQSELPNVIAVVDGPPIAAAADSLILASQADATILVVDAGRTRQEELVAAQRALTRAHARFAGVVLTQPLRARRWSRAGRGDASLDTRRPPRSAPTATHREALVSDAAPSQR